MMVVTRLQNGAYILSEVDGTVLHLKFAAFRLIPYQARSQKDLEITEFVDQKDLEGVNEEAEKERIDENNWGQLFLERKGKVWG